jgi:CubicO group peptidase (beta-lactamase class C family)
MKTLLPTAIFILLILSAFSCSPTNDQQEESSLEPVKSSLAKWAEQYELMGASVYLIANGELVLEEYLGYARLEDSTRTNENTTYRIASISKTLSTLAIMKLFEEGQVRLDEDVSTYLGWQLRNPTQPDQIITLKHLLGHTSSIRDGAGYGSFVRSMRADNLPIKELFQPQGMHFTQDMFSDKPIGSYFSYSNSAWGLIATVVEKVSGERFDRYCKRALFEPMGMEASFNILDIPIERVATLYRATQGAWIAQADDVLNETPIERAPDNYSIGTNGLLYGPQGSLRASAKDLYQLAKLLMFDGLVDGKQIFQKESIALLREEAWVYDGNNGDTWDNFWLSYGKGLHFITNTDSADVLFTDRTMQGHPGIAYGLLSDLYVDPQTKSGVIFITNGSKQPFEYGPTTSFYGVEESLFQILYPILLKNEGK